MNLMKYIARRNADDGKKGATAAPQCRWGRGLLAELGGADRAAFLKLRPPRA